MKRQELAAALKEAIHTEESATRVYLGHIKALATRFPLKKEFVQKAEEIISWLIEGNKKHKKDCEELLEEVLKEKSDVI